jgi:aerobic carbon-monoxide dehydrogenase small subunit
MTQHHIEDISATLSLPAEQARTVSVTLNGIRREAVAPVRMHLADFLRTKFEATGTHLGCEHGVCGACTVVLDGAAVRSCLILAVQADGSEVETVEGLAAPGEPLGVLQAAFRRHHGLQCGFCTPGMLMTLTVLLAEQPHATEAQIREAISGNICRCTGYQSIIAAALDAQRQLTGGA